MPYKKILTVQDISCVGQCSLTVALPVISACGIETCILPSAVLSSHTAFKGFTFRDLTDDIPGIVEHWRNEGIRFSAVYSGYLGSKKQIAYVKEIIETMGDEDMVSIVDPAMADNGKLYVLFDDEFVEAMKELVYAADYILPNITEACLLTGTEYREETDRDYIEMLLKKLEDAGAKNIILTGVSYREGYTGVAVSTGGEHKYYEHKKLPKGSHGTGDVYASAFTGALLNDIDAFEAARIAADYTYKCIENTCDDPDHWYGVKFEPLLGELCAAVKGKCC